MDADIAFKVLFRTRPQDLLGLTGDQGARVLSTGVPEVQQRARRPDFVLKLRRRGQVYLRHLEFQDRLRRGLVERTFAQNCMLLLQYRVPVVTTVILLEPPAPKPGLAYRVVLAGREMNVWHFEVVCLWEVDARRLLQGAPGALPLVAVAKDGDLGAMRKAATRIRAEVPEEQRADLLSTLYVLGERRYTRDALLRVLGREEMMQSSLFREMAQEMAEKSRAEGRTEGLLKGLLKGRTEGRTEGLRATREVCVAMVKMYHSSLAPRALAEIERCTDLKRLTAWSVGASKTNDEEFSRLLGLTPNRTAARAKAAPPRRSARVTRKNR